MKMSENSKLSVCNRCSENKRLVWIRLLKSSFCLCCIKTLRYHSLMEKRYTCYGRNSIVKNEVADHIKALYTRCFTVKLEGVQDV